MGEGLIEKRRRKKGRQKPYSKTSDVLKTDTKKDAQSRKTRFWDRNDKVRALLYSKDSNAVRLMIGTDVGRRLWQIGGQNATKHK